jgi:hypothetical protein
LPYADRDATPEHAKEVCRQFTEKGVARVFFAPLEFGPERDSVNREIVERLRFVARAGSAPTVDARVSGVREAIIRYGAGIDPGLMAQGDPADPRFVRSLDAGRGCDGIVCANDFTAAELLKVLASLKTMSHRRCAWSDLTTCVTRRCFRYH